MVLRRVRSLPLPCMPHFCGGFSLFFFFWRERLETHHVAEDSLELIIFLPVPPNCWDYKQFMLYWGSNPGPRDTRQALYQRVTDSGLAFWLQQTFERS